jgi:hypothetical protein
MKTKNHQYIIIIYWPRNASLISNSWARQVLSYIDLKDMSMAGSKNARPYVWKDKNLYILL